MAKQADISKRSTFENSPHNKGITCLQFGHDFTLWTSGSDGIVGQWVRTRWTNGVCIRCFRADDNVLRCLRVVQERKTDHTFVFVGGASGLRYFIVDGIPVFQDAKEFNQWVNSINNKKAENPDTLRDLPGHRGTVTAIAGTEDPQCVFSASEDGKVIKWKIGDEKDGRGGDEVARITLNTSFMYNSPLFGVAIGKESFSAYEIDRKNFAYVFASTSENKV